MAGPTRVALYVNFSTDEQRKNGSIPADQRRVLKEHAEREVFVAAKEVADNSLLGTRPYRPGSGASWSSRRKTR